jgi:lipoprotein-anchoring transpeptidase ErfK/SrfK
VVGPFATWTHRIALIAGIFLIVGISASVAGADDGSGSVFDGRTIQVGVAVGDLDVGGMTADEAHAAITTRFLRSFLLVVSPKWSKRVSPTQLGARARVDRAIWEAFRAGTGESVALDVAIDDGVLARFLERLAKQTDREPNAPRVRLVNLVPRWAPALPGRTLKQSIAAARLRAGLLTGVREPFPLPFIERNAPDAGEEKAIVIRRESKQLRLYVGSKLKRIFNVATGQSSYPTPLGRWTIVNKQRNPWWYPPQGSAWAAGKEPVPPGPGNPLGTRWMGLSSPQVGIHGTPDAASIGYSASHGCVRMIISQAEWLFDRVDVGTPVFIVPA